jgi:hypothetical protein
MTTEGKIFGSCGHELKDGDGWSVFYKDLDCDPIEGFVEVSVYATYCEECSGRDYIIERIKNE